jgi:hypothetical protein
MAKRTRKNKRRSKKSFLNKFSRNATRAIPVIASGIKNVGSDVVMITSKSRPKIEKGLGSIYEGVLTGFDLGVKGLKKGVSAITIKSSSKTRRNRRR